MVCHHMCMHCKQTIIISQLHQEMQWNCGQLYSINQLLISCCGGRVAALTWDVFLNTSESSSVILNAWLAAAAWLLKAMCLVFWGAPRSLLKLQCTLSASDREKHSSAWRDVYISHWVLLTLTTSSVRHHPFLSSITLCPFLNEQCGFSKNLHISLT